MEYYNFENSETFRNPKYRNLFNKIVRVLLKPQHEELFKRLNSEDENERKRILWRIIKRYNPKISKDEIFTTLQWDWTWDIEQVHCNYDGTSNWKEKCDIRIKVPQTGEIINWCSNWSDTAEATRTVTEWEIEFASKGGLEEVNIEQILYDEIKKKLFPDKKNLTIKEEEEVLDKRSELLKEINDLIPLLTDG